MSGTTKAKKTAVIKAKPKAARKTSTVVAPAPGPAPDTEPAPQQNTLEVPDDPGKSRVQKVADLMTKGQALNAFTSMLYMRGGFGESVDLSAAHESLKERAQEISAGDLTSCEGMLYAQAVSLNTIFTELARRSHLNMGEYLDASERYMRLALKAQSQSRATLETLAAVKNPPVVYTRQMNVANGPQQVNNGTPPGAPPPSPARMPETQSKPNELLEDATHGRTQLDTGAKTQAGRGHQQMETVGAVNRAQNR